MKVLVATTQSQGARPDDFAECVEGELVWPQDLCHLDDRHECECERAFAGFASHRSTTTAMVRDIPGLTRDGYIEIVAMSFADQGWPSALAPDLVDPLMSLASCLGEAIVIERRFSTIAPRFEQATGELRSVINGPRR